MDPTVQRGLWLDSALDEMRRDLEEDRFASAVGHFREALGLSRGLPQLKARVDEHAELHSEELLPRNWRVAEALLKEAVATDPPLSPDPELLEKVNQARQEELVCGAISRADRLANDGKEGEARARLAALLADHPDARIRDRIHLFDFPDGPVKDNAEGDSAGVQIQPLPPAEEDERESESSTGPTEGAVPEPLKPWQTKVLISSSAWNTTKDLAAVVATAGMLGIAGLLLWRHYSEQPSRPPQSRPVQPVLREPAKSDQKPQPVASSDSIFQDVPLPPSDQQTIIEAVRQYSANHGKKVDNDLVDEVDIQGTQAKVRFRSRDTTIRQTVVFSLIKQSDGWKVQKVE